MDAMFELECQNYLWQFVRLLPVRGLKDEVVCISEAYIVERKNINYL